MGGIGLKTYACGSPPVKKKMTTLEKLFLQIFDRKDRIIEQLQQQANAYTEQLASRLLIDGITPPPWLLNPSFNARSSNPNELEKEEIISRLLLQPSRDSVPYSSGGFSRYYRPVVAGGNGQLSTETCMETHAYNQGCNVSNQPPTTLECRNNDTGRSLNCVTEQDDSVNSPQDETDARISSIYAEPGASLARIQRSKSRQKARELRTSAKIAAKSGLGLENRSPVTLFFGGDSISKSYIHEITQDNCPSELDKCNHISGENLVAAEGEGDKGNVNGAMEGVDLPGVSLEGYTTKKSVTGKTQDTQRQRKRDIKVKALEAAEAAKRREQEKENERKMKKEALKLERARMEKENARELELNKKKKQEEQKKKEADIAARKRQREEDERKQMAKKRWAG